MLLGKPPILDLVPDLRISICLCNQIWSQYPLDKKSKWLPSGILYSYCQQLGKWREAPMSLSLLPLPFLFSHSALLLLLWSPLLFSLSSNRLFPPWHPAVPHYLSHSTVRLHLSFPTQPNPVLVLPLQEVVGVDSLVKVHVPFPLSELSQIETTTKRGLILLIPLLS